MLRNKGENGQSLCSAVVLLLLIFSTFRISRGFEIDRELARFSINTLNIYNIRIIKYFSPSVLISLGIILKRISPRNVWSFSNNTFV